MPDLLRVADIGPRSARCIEAFRRREGLRSVDALGALGVSWQIAAPFPLLDGRPAIRRPSLL